MDRQSILVVVVCVLLLFLWSFVLVPKMYPPKPVPPVSTNAPSATLTGTNLPNQISAPAAPLIEATNVLRIAVNATSPEELIEITNSNAHYTFTSYGGGL